MEFKAFNKMAVMAAAVIVSASASAQLLSRNRPTRPTRGNNAPEAAASAAANGAPDLAAAETNVTSPTLTINDQSIKEVLQYVYARLIKKSVIISPNVPDVKINFVTEKDQQLNDEAKIVALEALFEINGVHIQPYGADDRFVRAIARGDAPSDMPAIVKPGERVPESLRVVSRLIPFKNIAIEEAQKALEGFKSKTGQLMVFERTNTILVTDSAQNVNRMLEVAEMIDIATPLDENVFYYQVEHASATDIKSALETIVQESQKELEKSGKAQQNAANNTRMSGPSQPNTLLRRPGAAKDAPEPTPSIESIVATMSEADRGLIRGKVVILADERSNKLVIVTKPSNMRFFEQLIKQLDVETTPEVEVEVIRLKYAEAEDVADMINDLIGNSVSSKGTTKGNQNQNTRSGGTVNGTRERATNTQPRTPASSANARNGESRTGELSKDNVTVLADKRINGIVIMARKQDMASVREIVERMDVKLSQVLIETCIIEVTLGDDLNTGIDWVMRGRQRVTQSVQATDSSGRKLYYDSDGNTTTDSTDNTPIMTTVTKLVRDGFVNQGSSGLGGGGGSGSSILSQIMSVGTNAVSGAIFGGANPIGSGVNYLLKSDKLNLAAVIQATKSDSRAKYLASPIIMTVDNKEATVEATEARKFFNGYETSNSYSNYVRTPKYDNKDIGITIKVTPKINPNGTVMLKVEEEYSQLGAGQAILVDDGGTAQIDTSLTRKMSADVLLENQQSVILGGLTERYVSEKETGIPILKDIPWIGKWLFGSVSQTESRKELLVFMTPYVLDDGEMAQAEAMRRKNVLSDATPWDDLGWSNSKLADPVSKKEMLRRLKDQAKKQDIERQNKLAIEKWKMDRAKALEKMDESERKFWIETHREELEKEEKERFDREVKEQSDLKMLVESIKTERLEKAEAKIEENTEALKDESPAAEPVEVQASEAEQKGE